MDDIDLNSLVQSTQTLKLLYVDDLEDAREVVVEFLELFFDDISVAVDGEDAWEQYNSKKFDLILTDINMPNLNGLELSRRIREVDTNIAILVLSAYDKKEYFLDSIKYGIDAYLLKPFEMQQFVVAMLKVIKKIQNQKRLDEYSSKLQNMLDEKSDKREIPQDTTDEFHTNLPNSLKLQEDLLSGKFNYMLLLDMSNFEILKEKYGKQFATDIVIKTTHILKKLLNKNAKLYKIELYKFVILLKDVETMNIHFYCEQIGLFFNTKDVIVDDSKIHIAFHIGIDKIREDISQTLINCECALDIAKDSKNKHYEIYDEHTSVCKNRQDETDKLVLTRELILGKKIKPYFQPIKNLLSSKVEMYETFARGIMDEKLILPINFIKSSQKLGLSSEITKTMIDESFKFFHRKTDNFSINLTEADLLEGYLSKFLQDRVKEHNITPSRIIFEIPEEIILDNKSKKITKKITKLRKMGFKIAVDNFSVEHSNLNRLFEVELDFIKIDGSFIQTLKESQHNITITKAVVELAKTLGIKTVAKFVEDEELYELVRKCGIDYVQGYFIGSPKAEIR